MFMMMMMMMIDDRGVCSSVCLSHGSTVCGAFVQLLPNYFDLLLFFFVHWSEASECPKLKLYTQLQFNTGIMPKYFCVDFLSFCRLYRLICAYMLCENPAQEINLTVRIATAALRDHVMTTILVFFVDL